MAKCLPEAAIEEATVADLSELFQIESTAHRLPWSENLLWQSLQSEQLCWKLLEQGKIVGYLIVLPLVDEVELLNITVAPDYQGRGLGAFLLNFLASHAKSAGYTSIFLEVRESNHRAIALYQNKAYLQVGLRKNYYPVAETAPHSLSYSSAVRSVNCRENGLVMQLVL